MENASSCPAISDGVVQDTLPHSIRFDDAGLEEILLHRQRYHPRQTVPVQGKRLVRQLRCLFPKKAIKEVLHPSVGWAQMTRE